MARDLHNNIVERRVLSPIALTTTAAAAAKIIDRAGYEGVEFILTFGTRTTTGASVTPIVKEGDATGSMTSVANADLLGTEASAGVAAAASLVSGTHKNAVRKIGYIGNKRYVTCQPVPAGSTSFITGVTAILSNARHQPTST